MKPNDPCHCGSGRKYKKCCRGAAVPTAPRADFPTKQLILETPEGVFQRIIQSPAPLRAEIEAGKAAEEATLEAAQMWGLPDFVFYPKEEATGGTTRELGDGTIVVGGVALALQCKCREAATENEARETAWLTKNILKAVRQGRGSIRRMCLSPKELVNGRGVPHAIDANLKDWAIIVVIEHPQIPNGFRAPVGPPDTPIVVLTRQDWEFLFDQLKSTYAVCRYLGRSGNEERALGEEEVLYYQLATADASTEPEALPAAIADIGSSMSEPMLPYEPVAHTELAPFSIVRSVLEDVALMNVVYETGDAGLRVLAALDSLSVESRRILGNWILTRTDEIFGDDAGGIVWRFRVILGSVDAPHFGFAVCSRPYSDLISDAFGAWLELRHFEQQEALGHKDITSVGVLFTPTSDPSRPFDVTVKAAEGDLELSVERLEAIQDVWKSRAEVAVPIAVSGEG